MNPTRNIFFSFDHDDQMRPIAPVRTIPITDAIRRDDAARQAARKVVITWKPSLSDPSMKQAPSRKHTLPSSSHAARASALAAAIAMADASALLRACASARGAQASSASATSAASAGCACSGSDKVHRAIAGSCRSARRAGRRSRAGPCIRMCAEYADERVR